MGKMYFAKMNINEDIYEVYEGRKTLINLQRKIFTGINVDSVIYDEKGGRIKFFDLDIAPEGLKLTGNLGYIKQGVHSTYDPAKDTAIDTTDNNKLDYISFYLDVDNELLAYMTLPTLGRTKILQYFSRLIKEGSNVGVEFIQEANVSNIKQEIRQYQKLSKLTVKLVPPNGDKADFEHLASLTTERIEESNATKVQQTFQTQRKEGLNKDSELVQNYIIGSGLGYAELKFSGKDKNDELLEIDTNKHTPYTKYILSDQTKNHQKIADSGSKGIASIMKYRAELRLNLSNKVSDKKHQ